MMSLLRSGFRYIPVAALFVCLVAVPAPLPAQDPAEDPPAAEADSGDPAPTKAEQRRLAKEKRIEEYYRKQEAKKAAKQGITVEELEAQQLAERQAQEAAAAAAAQPESPNPAPPAKHSDPGYAELPAPLSKAQAEVRKSELSRNASVQMYLERIDRQQASPHELAAFANFLAENGLIDEAVTYYEIALQLEESDAVLWLNLGTLHRKAGDPSKAAGAYRQALGVDSNYAYAHYNLGAVYSQLNKYDQALNSYKTALLLDPRLGDPDHNPQAATNEMLLAVKVMLYQEEVGAIGTGLIDVGTELPDIER